MTTLIDDHVEQSLALFIDQYRDKPRLSGLLSSYIKQLQAAENLLWEVIIQRNVDNATGGQLDRLGLLVGQQRRGMDDDTYRTAVVTRIRANISLGHPNDVIETAQLALSVVPASTVGFIETDGGGYILVDGGGYILVG